MLRVYRDPLISSTLQPPREYTPFGLGYAVPPQDSLTLPDGVSIDFELIDGVLRCVAISIGQPPADEYADARARHGVRSGPQATPWLTGSYLRRLPIDRLSTQAAQLLGVRLYRRPRGEIVGVRAGAPVNLAELQTTTWDRRAAIEQLAQLSQERLRGERTPAPRRGRKPVPDEKIAEAAVIAREAQRKGTSANQAIEQQMHVQPSTAKKYVRLAREAGLLPAAHTRRASLGKVAARIVPESRTTKGARQVRRKGSDA